MTIKTSNYVLATIQPAFVYHAELEGRLYPHDRASRAEIAAMNARDFLDADDLETLAPPIVIKARAIADLARDEASRMPGKGVCERDPSALANDPPMGPAGPVRPVGPYPELWAAYRDGTGPVTLARRIGVSRMTLQQRLITHKRAAMRLAGLPVPVWSVKARRTTIRRDRLGL